MNAKPTGTETSRKKSNASGCCLMHRAVTSEELSTVTGFWLHYFHGTTDMKSRIQIIFHIKKVYVVKRMQHSYFDFLSGGWENNYKNKEDIHLEV